ncbi:hypothetical protein T12_16542 [Trichinella patagoniensis]|uniref:Uncharacterized protein n=1 Tax=Trichinella patagoniensis TaxID=990121 RepID=A0A0V0X1F4_9BILA|nr:hypothetical protein T12_16542 [Trichinella patagoniensis]
MQRLVAGIILPFDLRVIQGRFVLQVVLQKI